MTPGRILSVVIVIVAVAQALAAPAPDAFLERLRVGLVRDPAAMPMAGVWPAELFDAVPPQSQAATDPAPAPGSPFGLIASALLGGSEARSVWISDHVAGETLKQKRRTDACSAWRQGRYVACADSCALVLSEADLDPETRLVWSMRRRAALAAGGLPVPDQETIWPELLDLDSFDLQAGWDLWTGHRRALGFDLLPDVPLSDREVLWLMRLRTSHLSARDIDRARVSPPQRAALGAACLETAELPRHFGLYPEPPGDPILAGAWARGAWRRAAHTVEAAEHLGALASLPWTVRADYWRRAGDRHISGGCWHPGVAALAQAVDLAQRSGHRGTRRRVAEECGRAASLAHHQGRRDLIPQLSLWAEQLWKDEPEQPERATEVALVRSGEAPNIEAEGSVDLTAIEAAVRRRLWTLWEEVGRKLAAGNGSGELGQRYLEVLDAQKPLAAMAVALSHHPLRDSVLAWSYRLDREADSEGGGPVDESPIPSLVSGLGSAPSEQIVRHALTGLCLMIGDTRGRLACAVSLSRPGLDAAGNRLFIYPLPSRPAILAEVQQSADPALVLAVARNESLFDPGVRSSAGALGWMQVMPFHFEGHGLQDGVPVWRIPSHSVRKGLALLEENRRRYEGDPYRVLAAYNAGPGAVNRWDRQMGGTPSRADFLGWIGYPETRRYVEQVLIDRQIYATVLRDFAGEETSGP